MNKILVIGGAGFIGSHTVVALVDGGYEPVIVDNFSNSEKFIIDRLNILTGKKIKCYENDYRDSAKVKEIIKNENISGIIDFAAYKAVGESVELPIKYYSNNVSGFVELLKVVLETGVKNVVFSSSAAVYGTPDDIFVSEDADCNPTSAYGWSKFFDEIILQDTCRANIHLNGVALRYFNVVGAHPSSMIGELPKGKPQNLLPIIVKAITSGQKVSIFGDNYPTPDGTCLRDYVHVVDLANAHVKALDYFYGRKGGFDIFNIGNGSPTSVKELILTFEKENNIKVPYVIGAKRAGDPAAYYAKNNKATKKLKWQAEYNINDAVKDAWNWHKSLEN